MPPGKTQTLIVQVSGSTSGQYQNLAFAKADGIKELQSASQIVVESVADLTMHVKGRSYVVEVGKENVYEITVQNPGNASASNLRLQRGFPAGLFPRAPREKSATR